MGHHPQRHDIQELADVRCQRQRFFSVPGNSVFCSFVFYPSFRSAADPRRFRSISPPSPGFNPPPTSPRHTPVCCPRWLSRAVPQILHCSAICWCYDVCSCWPLSGLDLDRRSPAPPFTLQQSAALPKTIRANQIADTLHHTPWMCRPWGAMFQLLLSSPAAPHGTGALF